MGTVSSPHFGSHSRNPKARLSVLSNHCQRESSSQCNEGGKKSKLELCSRGRTKTITITKSTPSCLFSSRGFSLYKIIFKIVQVGPSQTETFQMSLKQSYNLTCFNTSDTKLEAVTVRLLFQVAFSQQQRAEPLSAFCNYAMCTVLSLQEFFFPYRKECNPSMTV